MYARGHDFFLSFFLYILPGARFRALSAGVHCTLRIFLDLMAVVKVRDAP